MKDSVTRTFAKIFGLLGLALLMSCGGKATLPEGGQDASSEACGTVAACGGELLGTWRVTKSCLTETEDLSKACPGASATVDFAFGGTVTYNADLTYTANVLGGGTTHYHYPSACLPGGASCDGWGQTLMLVGMYTSVTCTTDSGGACNCDALTASSAHDATGTYATSGTGTLTTVHEGAVSGDSYCVSGNVMYQMPLPTDGGVTEPMGGLVLVKQSSP